MVKNRAIVWFWLTLRHFVSAICVAQHTTFLCNEHEFLIPFNNGVNRNNLLFGTKMKTKSQASMANIFNVCKFQWGPRSFGCRVSNCIFSLGFRLILVINGVCTSYFIPFNSFNIFNIFIVVFETPLVHSTLILSTGSSWPNKYF